MQKIPLMLAKAGMVLARDVFRGESPSGMPVCGKETILTETLISRLDQMDVQSVYVEGHPIWEEAGQSFDELLAELDRRFEKNRHEPLNATLYETYKAQLVKSMGGDGDR